MKVEDDVDDVLVSPCDGQTIVLVDGDDVLLPTEATETGQVHQHHPGVDACGGHDDGDDGDWVVVMMMMMVVVMVLVMGMSV